MRLKGNITKSAGKYTVSVSLDGVCVYRHKGINNLSFAQDKIKEIKSKIIQCQDYIRPFSELEDKIVDWRNGSLRFKAQVIGCDFWIGITMVRASDTTRYSTCVLGPLAPQIKDRLAKGDFKEIGAAYIDNFKNIVDAIKSGTYDVQKLYDRNVKRNGVGPTAESCPFGQ